MKTLILLILILCALPKDFQTWLLICVTFTIPFMLICFINEQIGYRVTGIVFIFLILCYFFPILDNILNLYKKLINKDSN